MKITLELDEPQAVALADLLQQEGARRAHERALNARRNLLSVDHSVEPHEPHHTIALVAAKLANAHLLAQRADDAAWREAQSLFSALS